MAKPLHRTTIIVIRTTRTSGKVVAHARLPEFGDLPHAIVVRIDEADSSEIRATVLIRLQVDGVQIGRGDDKLVIIRHQSHLLGLLEHLGEDFNGAVDDDVNVIGELDPPQH